MPEATGKTVPTDQRSSHFDLPFLKQPGPSSLESRNTASYNKGADYFRSLAGLAGKNTLDFKAVKTVPLPLADDPVGQEEHSRCLEIKTGGKHLGYARAWLPGAIVDRINNGEAIYDLWEIFPTPISNIYYEILDEANVSLGKAGRTFKDGIKKYIYSFLWNDGKEDELLLENGLYYLVDSQGTIIDENPTWVSEQNKVSGNEEIYLFTDPTVRLKALSHETGDEFYYRLQDSCSNKPNMLPNFVRITQGNFGQFVRETFE